MCRILAENAGGNIYKKKYNSKLLMRCFRFFHIYIAFSCFCILIVIFGANVSMESPFSVDHNYYQITEDLGISY